MKEEGGGENKVKLPTKNGVYRILVFPLLQCNSAALLLPLVLFFLVGVRWDGMGPITFYPPSPLLTLFHSA